MWAKIFSARVLFADYAARLLAEMIPQGQNRAMETDRAMETVEKQTAFFHRSHSAWKTRPRASSFPQFPQPLRLVQIETKTAEPRTRNDRLPRVFDTSNETPCQRSGRAKALPSRQQRKSIKRAQKLALAEQWNGNEREF